MRKIARLRSKIKGFPNTQALVDSGLKLGSEVYFGRGTSIDPEFAWLVSIGDETTFGPDVRVLAHDASTRKFLGYTRCGPVNIGSNVFVGSGSIILPGVTIGDRAIIGAGSVIRRNVDAATVVSGNPATFICSTGEYLDRQQEKLEAWKQRLGNLGLDESKMLPSDGPLLRGLIEDGYGFVK